MLTMLRAGGSKGVNNREQREVSDAGEDHGLADATEKLALAASTGKTVHESSESLFESVKASCKKVHRKGNVIYSTATRGGGSRCHATSINCHEAQIAILGQLGTMQNGFLMQETVAKVWKAMRQKVGWSP